VSHRGAALTLALTLLASSAFGEGAAPLTPERAPLVTVERIAMPSEARRTLFVLYDDGVLIYDVRKRGTDFGSGYASVTLTAAERAAFVASLPAGAEFRSMQPSYDAAPNTFDGLWQQICVFGKERKCVGVRGVLYKDEAHNNRARAPLAFLDLYDRLVPYAHARGKPWVPSEIALRAYPESRSVAAKPWPLKWTRPLTPQEHGVPGHTETTYTFALPGKELRALQVFLDDHRSVMIDGKRMYVHLELALPAEASWRAR
jgi:hypothetical protein